MSENCEKIIQAERRAGMKSGWGGNVGKQNGCLGQGEEPRSPLRGGEASKGG